MEEKVKQAFQTIKDSLEEYEFAEDDFNFRHIKTGKYICEEELSIVETVLNQAEENKKIVNQFHDILKLLKSNCKYALRHNDFNTFCVIVVNENLNYLVEKTICLNEVLGKYGKKED